MSDNQVFTKNNFMQQLEELIKATLQKDDKKLLTFLTGAGISTDSNIPTYRGTGGLWVRGSKLHKPEEFATYSYFIKHPEEFWQFILFRKKLFERAKPNKSHFELVEIEELLDERFQLITQNVDNLHIRAGSKKIFEVHGNNREVKCSLNCKTILPFPKEVKGKDIDADLTKEDIKNLKCPECGAWLRPNVLLFDEYYDERTNKYDSSIAVAQNTAILFIIGTFGSTTLPMQIAQTTMNYEGTIIDINTEDNSFTDLLEDIGNKIILRGKSSDILPKIKNIIAKNLN